MNKKIKRNNPGNNLSTLLLAVVSAVLASIPWLVPHTGLLILIAFVPLLFAERVATDLKMRGFHRIYFLSFLVWNALTTFWVGGATVGGAVFAIIANALQMTAVFALFRFSRKRLGDNLLPYIFLLALWVTWEKLYFNAEISWPWLALGGAFADTTSLVQWYSVTGMLGGSVWILVCNIAVFRLICALAEGRTVRQLIYSAGLTVFLLGAPVATSLIMYNIYTEKSEGTVDVLIGQPNFDPYLKFQSMTQGQQTEVLLDQWGGNVEKNGIPDLMIAPETFTSDIFTTEVESSNTVKSIRQFISGCCASKTDVLMGASTYDFIERRSAPSPYAYQRGGGWLQSYNSAVMLPAGKPAQIRHKSKLVVGTELTPYPKVFLKIEKWICNLFDLSSPLMGRCVPGGKAKALTMSDGTKVGCAVCYESVYGEFCADYVRDGAEMMTVVTNDAWWGDTPGYRQHLNFSRLRAIELRRDIARCANTGISAFIDQRGDVVSESDWWTRATLRGTVNKNREITPFVKMGDVAGRACELLLALLVLAFIAIPFSRRG